MQEKKLTVIIDNIISPYAIARYNAISNSLRGKMEVWFQKRTDLNRYWKKLPKINFKYRFLDEKHDNFLKYFDYYELLKKYKHKTKRIIVCGWDSIFYLAAFVFSKINKIRITIWSGSTIYEKSFMRFVSLPLVKLMIKHADDFIAYGDRARAYLIGLGIDKEKIKIFLNSVDVDYFNNQAKKLKKSEKTIRKRYNISSADTVFLFIGQLIDRKGIKELVEAFIELSKKNNNITLLIVGEGKLKSWLQSILRSSNRDSIKFLGYVQYDRLAEVYSVSDVLVLPSKQEVWGLVVNEALASGIPVIASKFCGCIDDILDQKNSIIINNINSKEIMDAAKKIIQKKKIEIEDQILDKMQNMKYANEVFK